MKFSKWCTIVLLATVAATWSACNNQPKETATTTPPQDTVPAPSPSARPVHWGYEGENGPANWASLSPAYALCSEGKGQSPINIVKTDAKGAYNWQFDYKNTSLRIAHNEHMEDIIDNGHTIQVTVDEGSTFTFNNKTYTLKQFHFHTPSEHTLDGKYAPMEMHMVHQSDDGKLAVVGILFKEGKKPNANLAKIIANMPKAKGDKKHITDANFDLKFNLPKDNYAYHYTGSLTTPPCSEGVQWLVLRNPVEVTADQVKAFSSVIGPNNRPVQALNDRAIEATDLKGRTTN